MANIKSAKKRARQTIKKRARNQARRSSVKTAVKKVLTALEQGEKPEAVRILFKDAESQISRARGKGLFHANTASRKVSRLAKKVASATK